MGMDSETRELLTQERPAWSKRRVTWLSLPD